MTDIVNLNRFRKKRARAEKEKRAEENRAKHGRAKAEKTVAKIEEERAKRVHEGHRTEADKGEE